MLALKFALVSLCALPSMAIRLQNSLSSPQHPDHSINQKPPKGYHWNGPKIVCTGWKKTGTNSMHVAYNLLGIMPVAPNTICAHPRCLDKFASTEDAYTCCNHGMVKTMKKIYPADKVKFVHLERDTQKWHLSVKTWLQKPDKGGYWKGEYSRLMKAPWNSAKFAEKYEEHNQYIKDLFADEPDRLLVMNLEKGNSTEHMMKFCEFVGIDPTSNENCMKPFPHEHHQTNAAYEARKAALPNLKVSTENSEGVSAEWLNVDEDETEFKGFDWDIAERDWESWCADRNGCQDS